MRQNLILMKNKLYLLALAAIVICGCDAYLVPDDFPKEEFYSYAPYQLGQTVRFVSNEDTLYYTVSGISEDYDRRTKKCDCGKEHVSKYVTFSQPDSERNEDWILSVNCTDRAIFSVSIYSYEAQSPFATYEVNYGNENIWSRSFDNSKIFKSFADEIILTQEDNPSAKLKKGEGVLWFVEATGRTWKAE